VWRDNLETMALRLALVTNTVAALTDSSTGTAGSSLSEMATFVNVADGGTTSAQKASAEAEMADVKNAIASLFSKANALAAGIGAPVRAYDGEGSVSDTLAAIGAITAAITGVQATEMNTWRAQIHIAFDSLAEHVNEIAALVDVAPVSRAVQTASFPFDNPVNPQQEKSDLNATTRAQSRFRTSRLTPTPGSVLSVDGGTAADPAVTKAAADTALTVVKNNLATIAAKLNAIRTAVHGPLVKVV
jgi:osmotically-inducible protein OsmY